MDEEDKQDCCDTDPVYRPSVSQVVFGLFLMCLGTLFFIATVMPFAMAWSSYLTEYFGLR